MTPWEDRELGYGVYINGESVMFNGLTISSRMDQLAAVATFDLVDDPILPAKGDSVRIDQINTTTLVSTTVFLGHVWGRDTEGYPHRVGIVAQDVLGKLTTCLRHRSDGRLVLGKPGGPNMTDGEIIMEILEYCGVAFMESDIADTGFPVGQRVEISWLADGSTPASTITEEIDRVFFSKLQAIGNGRVIRKFYTLVSEATSGVRNYVRGTDRRLFANRRADSEITAIANHIEVTGPGEEGEEGTDLEGCTLTAHASAHTDNEILEGWTGRDHARAPILPFQSDFIQDASQAGYVANKLIQIHNRETIQTETEVQSEPQIYLGRIVTLRDNTYGIGLNSPQALTVWGVEDRIDSKHLTLIGGPPGSTGTLTAEIEIVCNEEEDSDDRDDGFEGPPDSEFPDLDPGYTPVPIDVWDDFDPPVAPNIEDPFLCTGDPYGVCPEDVDGVCYESLVASSACIGTPPADPCSLISEWRPRIFISEDEFPVPYSCDCEITAYVREEGGNEHKYLVQEDGSVDRITACMFEDEGSGSGSAAYRISDVLDGVDDSTDKRFTGTVCFSFNYRFCSEGEEIRIHLYSTDSGDNISALAEHRLALHAEPGGHYTSVFSDFNYQSSMSHTDSAVAEGDAEPHTSFGTSNRNNGGIGGKEVLGLPIGQDLTAYGCWEMDGDLPKGYWNNGVESGYIQHLPYIDEENPLPGEPTINPEDPDHIAHVIEIRLFSGDGSVFCDNTECPGPMIWGFEIGHSDCAENPDFNPDAGDDDA